MKPYYEQDGISIYHGDCREVWSHVGRWDSIITDPVWPNAVAELAGSYDPAGLFKICMHRFARVGKRVVVHLGCDSDPRFLSGLPDELPFFRGCNLEYVRPHYKGRLLYTHDVAYAFGVPPVSRPGRHVVPGRCIQNDAAKKPTGHPCPRQLQHAQWLVRWFADGLVFDPFMGIGTTLLACKMAGIEAAGCDVNEQYCETAANRLTQGVLFGAASA